MAVVYIYQGALHFSASYVELDKDIFLAGARNAVAVKFRLKVLKLHFTSFFLSFSKLQAVFVQLPQLVLQLLRVILRAVVFQIPQLLSNIVIFAVSLVTNSLRFVLLAVLNAVRALLTGTGLGFQLINNLVGQIISGLMVSVVRVGIGAVSTLSLGTQLVKSVLDAAFMLVFRTGFLAVRSVGFGLQLVNALVGQFLSSILIGAGQAAGRRAAF